MDIDQCRSILQKACEKCESDWIALSGGLDSSVIANLMKKEKTHAITIITKDFVGTDLTYAQIMAKYVEIPLSLMHIDLEGVLEAINETVKILGNFNDIEIRNSVVPYIYLKSLKDDGINSVITGDGADEVFAGYNFLLKKNEDELVSELSRIKKIMHFPSKEIGESLNMKVEMPFLDNDVIDFSENIPISEKINTKDGKRFGKWILRKSFENEIPDSIVWREKSPMQDGSGTANLTNLFNSIITDEIFSQKRNEILEKDGVYIRTKESLHYYECFRKINSVKKSNSENKCPDCNYELEVNSRFCRMCGNFPIV